MRENTFLSAPSNDGVVGRQICLFSACVLPVYKLLELPSLLSGFVGGDILLPAFLQYVLQTGVLLVLLFLASRSEKPLLERLEEKFGKWTFVCYALYAVYFLFVAVLPLLDAEKFVYATFFDTAPTLFSFAFFFFFSAFVCARGVKALGRFADLSVFLFLLPFFALIVMSLVEADASNLLPIFEHRFERTVSAFTYTTPHFSDVALLLPLIGNLRYKKGDGTKIACGYGVGALLSLLFLGVFYSLYSTIAPREHYAFAKIAQYFPALTVIGRIDLLFVYMLSIVLFVYVATPLQYAVDLTARCLGTKRRVWLSAVLSIGAFFFVLFCNKYYNAIYAFFGRFAYPVFWIFSVFAPLSLFFFLRPKKEERYA